MALKFEDKVEVLDDLIKKNRGRWKLSSISSLDYEDVAQLIRIHIYEKWPQYDQSKPFEFWANKIIANQIKNLIRDNYGRYAPPCVGCKFDRDHNFCGFTKSGYKCAECPLYKNWAKKKQDRFLLKTPTSIDHDNFKETPTRIDDNLEVDIEKNIPRFHDHMMSILSPRMALFYSLIFVECVSDEEICSTKTPKGKNLITYRQLINIKNTLTDLGKKEILKFDLTT